MLTSVLNSGVVQASVSELFAESAERVRCLLIAPPDEQMLARVRLAIGTETFVHLPVTQSVWCEHKYELLATVRQLVESATISQVMIIGHSLAGRSEANAASTNKSNDNARNDSGIAEHAAGESKNERLRALQHTQELANCFQRSGLFSAQQRGPDSISTSTQPMLNAYFFLAESGVFKKVHCASGDLAPNFA
ncbi:MAG: hypothetical protein AAGG44_01870 [Planctomycetota bacterium]